MQGLKKVKFLAIALSVLATLLILSHLFPLTYGSIGTTDFIQYWRSWYLLIEGKNPYDPSLAIIAQNDATQSVSPYIAAWNPPWTFVMLSPALLLPFPQSATLWMLLQILALGVMSITLPRALGLPRPGLILSASITTVFFPVLNSLYLGQLGILIALSLTLFLSFQRRGALFAAGVAIVPLSIKPHLLFLFIVPGLLWLTALRRQQLRAFLGGAFAGLGALITCTLIVSPNSISAWVVAMTSPLTSPEGASAVPLKAWQTTNISTWLRCLFGSNEIPSWPMMVVPVTALIVTALYFWRRRSAIIWERVTPPLLCVSLLTSNYGWVFDQSVLLITQVAVVCGALTCSQRIHRVALVAAAFLIQIIAILRSSDPQHHFVWLPAALLVLLILQRRLEPARPLMPR